MGKKSTPKPPDLGPYADAMEAQGEFAYLTSQEQLAWAREQDTSNRALLQQVLGPQLEAQQNQADWAKKDRARYENVYQPVEDNLIEDFQSYGSPERMQQDRSRAMADVATSFDAQRRNALQRLESYGVDPSQTRNHALDMAMRTQQGAGMAAAGTNAQRVGEDKARALRADAINIGRGMPSQVAQSYGQSVAAGNSAIGGANSTFGTSAGAMGNPTAWGAQGMQGSQGAAGIQTQGFNNQMTAYNAQQAANASMMSGIGGAMGMAAMLADGGQPMNAPGMGGMRLPPRPGAPAPTPVSPKIGPAPGGFIPAPMGGAGGMPTGGFIPAPRGGAGGMPMGGIAGRIMGGNAGRSAKGVNSGMGPGALPMQPFNMPQPTGPGVGGVFGNMGGNSGFGGAPGFSPAPMGGGPADFRGGAGAGQRALPFSTGGPVDEGPTDGSGVDDQVPAKLSVGEYVIPADVVNAKGTEYFDRLVEKYHTPAAEQRQQQALPTGAWS